uniref:tRNA (guanine(46)-N(7))-methyltransferase n=1 Tax=Kalanchoe fedtschenkoi TaxID=63787 RepID=A0A7N0ZR13_KALFE
MAAPTPFASLPSSFTSRFPGGRLTSHASLSVRHLHLPRCSRTASCSPERVEFKERHGQGEVLAAGSKGLIAMEYAELDLVDKVCYEVGHVRIRPHVNPLNSFFTVPVEVPDWNLVFKDAKLPLMVDIGCGSGRFLLWMAKRNTDTGNYLGLEIRHKLAKRAEHWVGELGLHNIHFMYANAMVSFQQLVSVYPGPLTTVSILCPDPHFKNKHRKRRVVQKSLVDSIVKELAPGGQIFIQSDVLDVALDMRSQFDARSKCLEHVNVSHPTIQCDEEGWLLSNPMGIRTEREIHAELEGARIYRRLYQKRSGNS